MFAKIKNKKQIATIYFDRPLLLADDSILLLHFVCVCVCVCVFAFSKKVFKICCRKTPKTTTTLIIVIKITAIGIYYTLLYMLSAKQKERRTISIK